MSAAVRPETSELLPRGVLLSIGALVVVALLGTAAVRWSGVDIRQADAPAVSSRLLRFADAEDGSVLVIDAQSGAQAARLQGEQGFLRGVVRALVRERRASGIGSQPAFELVLRADGRLTLMDPATRERIDLESFGPTNTALFAQLLSPAAPATP